MFYNFVNYSCILLSWFLLLREEAFLCQTVANRLLQNAVQQFFSLVPIFLVMAIQFIASSISLSLQSCACLVNSAVITEAIV
jgi:hypothetical protein